MLRGRLAAAFALLLVSPAWLPAAAQEACMNDAPLERVLNQDQINQIRAILASTTVDLQTPAATAFLDRIFSWTLSKSQDQVTIQGSPFNPNQLTKEEWKTALTLVDLAVHDTPVLGGVTGGAKQGIDSLDGLMGKFNEAGKDPGFSTNAKLATIGMLALFRKDLARLAKEHESDGSGLAALGVREGKTWVSNQSIEVGTVFNDLTQSLGFKHDGDHKFGGAFFVDPEKGDLYGTFRGGIFKVEPGATKQDVDRSLGFADDFLARRPGLPAGGSPALRDASWFSAELGRRETIPTSGFIELTEGKDNRRAMRLEAPLGTQNFGIVAYHASNPGEDSAVMGVGIKSNIEKTIALSEEASSFLKDLRVRLSTAASGFEEESDASQDKGWLIRPRAGIDFQGNFGRMSMEHSQLVVDSTEDRASERAYRWTASPALGDRVNMTVSQMILDARDERPVDALLSWNIYGPVDKSASLDSLNALSVCLTASGQCADFSEISNAKTEAGIEIRKWLEKGGSLSASVRFQASNIDQIRQIEQAWENHTRVGLAGRIPFGCRNAFASLEGLMDPANDTYTLSCEFTLTF